MMAFFLTKFIYWIKNLKNKKITEIDAEKKLEKFRKKVKIFYIQVSIQLLAQGLTEQLFTTEQQNKQTRL